MDTEARALVSRNYSRLDPHGETFPTPSSPLCRRSAFLRSRFWNEGRQSSGPARIVPAGVIRHSRNLMGPRPATQPGFFISIGTRPRGVELPSVRSSFAKSALDYSASRSVAFTSAGRLSLAESAPTKDTKLWLHAIGDK
jgi:hypothetical protein